jgi:hypothetical protein
MRIFCWIPKATNTYSEYVIHFAFAAATMDARKCLNIMLYVLCLSCYSSYTIYKSGSGPRVGDPRL